MATKGDFANMSKRRRRKYAKQLRQHELAAEKNGVNTQLYGKGLRPYSGYSNTRGRGRGRGRGGGRGGRRRVPLSVQCYNCQGYGHFARDCKKPKRDRNGNNNNRNNRPRNAYFTNHNGDRIPGRVEAMRKKYNQYSNGNNHRTMVIDSRHSIDNGRVDSIYGRSHHIYTFRDRQRRQQKREVLNPDFESDSEDDEKEKNVKFNTANLEIDGVKLAGRPLQSILRPHTGKKKIKRVEITTNNAGSIRTHGTHQQTLQRRVAITPHSISRRDSLSVRHDTTHPGNDRRASYSVTTPTLSNFQSDENKPRFKRHEHFRVRKYGINDRVVRMKIEQFDEPQIVYFDGGSTLDIIDERTAETIMYLAKRCTKFGVNTAGGLVQCSSFIPLEVEFKGLIRIIRWYIIPRVELPHRWILSRYTLGKFGYTDAIIKCDKLNNDTIFVNNREIIQGYEGDDGPWMQKSYPLPNRKSFTTYTPWREQLLRTTARQTGNPNQRPQRKSVDNARRSLKRPKSRFTRRRFQRPKYVSKNQ